MVVMSGSVGHQFSIRYSAVHKAVVVIIPSTDCTMHIKFQKSHAVENYIHFVMSPMRMKVHQISLLKCKNNGVVQSKIKHDAR